MSKTYLPYDPDQQLLLPDDHLACFISDVVDQLELSDITASYEQERRGGPLYHPRLWSRSCSTATASEWRHHGELPSGSTRSLSED